ncbi:hypothetical protein RHGRI_019681 [Rhododendron griersonianum]|uniref:Disease resistance N-terminal domain-containing protein n=1 Tax=Rhododendron griersonianum TaxID=479676 RepID=A0AAV6JGG0_9ERIC|nr:hypothetical protein RHGRI_019681 [Rhododendron griersonianum]
MAVAEIFLAAFLQGLVRMLTAQDLLSFARREKIHDLLMKWSRMLGEIDAVLADAEEKQMKTEQRGIKLWLEDLEDLAYDLDDILDEFSTEAFHPPPSATLTHHLRPFTALHLSSSLNPSPSPSHPDLVLPRSHFFPQIPATAGPSQPLADPSQPLARFAQPPLAPPPDPRRPYPDLAASRPASSDPCRRSSVSGQLSNTLWQALGCWFFNLLLLPLVS